MAQARNSAPEGKGVLELRCPAGRPNSEEWMKGDRRQNTHSSSLFIRRKRETPNGNRQKKHPQHKCTRGGKARVKICWFVCGGPGMCKGIGEGVGEQHRVGSGATALCPLTAVLGAGRGQHRGDFCSKAAPLHTGSPAPFVTPPAPSNSGLLRAHGQGAHGQSGPTPWVATPAS